MRTNESGFTLVGVLAVFTIISVFGISLVMLSISSVKTSNTEHDDQSVFYIAEAGANYMLNKLENEVNTIYDSNKNITEVAFYDELASTLTQEDQLYDSFENVNDELPTASITVSLVPDTQKKSYKITSEGTIRNQKRTVERTFSVNYSEGEETEGSVTELPPFAVFISGGEEKSFDLQGGTINGDIGILSTRENGIKLEEGVTLAGDIYIPGGTDNKNVLDPLGNEMKIKDYTVTYKFPELPGFPELPANLTKLPDQEHTKHSENTDLIQDNKLLIINSITNNYTLSMNEDLEFREIKIAMDNTLYIDTGNQDRAIVVSKFDLKNGHIKLKGSGKLTIYIKDEISMKSSSTINKNGDINRINVFYKGNEKLDLQGEQRIYGSIYVDQADIKLQGSAKIYGNIFSGSEGKIELQGETHISSQLILAPNAHVEIEGSGSIKGRIIARKFEMQGGGKVTLEEPFILDGPISPSALGKQNSGDEGTGDGNGSTGTGSKPEITTSPIREIETK